jgi:hypothetical protein
MSKANPDSTSSSMDGEPSPARGRHGRTIPLQIAIECDISALATARDPRIAALERARPSGIPALSWPIF